MIDTQPSLEGCEPKPIHHNPTLAIYEIVIEAWLPPYHVTQEHCFEDWVWNIKRGMRWIRWEESLFHWQEIISLRLITPKGRLQTLCRGSSICDASVMGREFGVCLWKREGKETPTKGGSLEKSFRLLCKRVIFNLSVTDQFVMLLC